MSKLTPEIILASASPRRRELMTQTGFSFKVVVSDIDETSISVDRLSPEKYAEKLAQAKAENIARRYQDSIVIGADTIVDFNGRIIGKPSDASEARDIIKTLFSSSHKVITGIAVIQLSRNIKLISHDITIVYPRQMTPLQIEEHINNGTWQDKAGAYAIQETEDKFVERIQGSMSNVMGLPMELLERMLKKVCNL